MRHLLASWRKLASGPLYHITDNANFSPDPAYVPEDNALSIAVRDQPGLYLTGDPTRWLQGYGYWRPYLVEFSGAQGVAERWGGEIFVPAENFSSLSISRVIPIDGYCREEYELYGWTEDYFQTTFDTFEPISDEEIGRQSSWDPPWPNYRSPDARSLGGGWQGRYESRVAEYQSSHPGVY